jgi:hypothetical protein
MATSTIVYQPRIFTRFIIPELFKYARRIPVMPRQDDCIYRREIDPTGADRAKFISRYEGMII